MLVLELSHPAPNGFFSTDILSSRLVMLQRIRREMSTWKAADKHGVGRLTADDNGDGNIYQAPHLWSHQLPWDGSQRNTDVSKSAGFGVMEMLRPVLVRYYKAQRGSFVIPANW
jgi:hypothetical protein